MESKIGDDQTSASFLKACEKPSTVCSCVISAVVSELVLALFFFTSDPAVGLVWYYVRKG